MNPKTTYLHITQTELNAFTSQLNEMSAKGWDLVPHSFMQSRNGWYVCLMVRTSWETKKDKA